LARISAGRNVAEGFFVTLGQRKDGGRTFMSYAPRMREDGSRATFIFPLL